MTPAECHTRLLNLHSVLLGRGASVDGIVVGAIARCVFRQHVDGTVSQRPISQIKRELLSQANVFRRWRNESLQIRNIGLMVAYRLQAISANLPGSAPGRPSSLTAKPARYLLNELAPLFVARLAAAGQSELSRQVLAKGLRGEWQDAGRPTDGWKLFEDFILSHAPQAGVTVTKTELRQARRDYRRNTRRQMRRR